MDHLLDLYLLCISCTEITSTGGPRQKLKLENIVGVYSQEKFRNFDMVFLFEINSEVYSLSM